MAHSRVRLPIPLKLTIVLAITAFVMFGMYARRQLATEESDLRASIEREMRLLSRSLQVALENAIRDEQVEDVREMLERLELVDREIDVFVFNAAGSLRTSSVEEKPTTAHQAVRQLAEKSRQLEMKYDFSEDPTVLIAAVPLQDDDGKWLGAVVVNRPLTDLRADIEATRRASIFLVLIAVVVTGLIVFGLGFLSISRPLRRLHAGMQRVRHGDFGTALPEGARDEVGALALEFNAMLRELQEARKRLQAEAETRRQLQQALQSADKLATIGQLSAGLAHEIGSPLQILIGRANALSTRDHDAEAVRRQAGIIVTQGQRITRIVEQLLRFARRRPGAMEPVDLRHACHAVIDLLEVESKRRGVALKLQVDEPLPKIHASEDQMQQMVLNLLTNALAATPPGGRITLTLNEPADDDALVRLVVEDTGRGIPEEDIARLFEPFFTTRTDEGGSGLGLAVVNAIVVDHAGTISVESKVGKGSRFIVTLPIDKRTFTGRAS